MSRRLKVLVLLLTLAAGAVAGLLVQQNYDRLFPRDACYTRDGTDIGDFPLCAAGKRAIEERLILPDMLDNPYDEPTQRACQKACRQNEWCSHYVFRLPPEYHNSNVIPLTREPFSCLLLQH